MDENNSKKELLEEIKRLERKVTSLEFDLEREKEHHAEHVRQIEERHHFADLYRQDSAF